MNERLYVLPFDHRHSFMKIIGASSPPTKKDIQKAKNYKNIIYSAFRKSLSYVSKKESAILVDEWLGKSILKDARKKKIITCNTFEKSGQEEFQFERKDWKKQLVEIKPDYAKVLIRYNPKNKKINLRQAKKLYNFGNYLKKQKVKFLLEVITPNRKPRTILKAIKQLQKNKVNPDVWKLEGIDTLRGMKKISKEVRSKIVILGRGGNRKKVKQWVEVAAKFDNVIGFAIGRTIFAPALRIYNTKLITKKQAIERISKNYIYFVKVFERAKLEKEKRGGR